MVEWFRECEVLEWFGMCEVLEWFGVCEVVEWFGVGEISAWFGLCEILECRRRVKVGSPKVCWAWRMVGCHQGPPGSRKSR